MRAPLLSYVLHLALQKWLSLRKHTLVVALSASNMHRNAAQRLWLQGCSSMYCGSVFQPWAKQLRCCNSFKFYFYQMYFQWNSLCSQGPTVCFMSRVRSKPMARTLNCMPPSDLKKIPTPHLHIFQESVCVWRFCRLFRRCSI